MGRQNDTKRGHRAALSRALQGMEEDVGVRDQFRIGIRG